MPAAAIQRYALFPPARPPVPATPATLRGVYASARPGDHIALGPGNYGAMRLDRPGRPGAPVVVRAASRLGARVTGRWTFAAAFNDIFHLDFDGADAGLAVTADDCRALRCRFSDFGSVGVLCTVTRARFIMAYCEARRCKTEGVEFNPSDGGTSGEIYRCHFHDWDRRGGTNGFEVISIGLGRDDTDIAARNQVRYCLFEDINNGNGENETISVKSSDNVVEFCHAIDAKAFTNRHGERNVWRGCRVEGDLGFQHRDEDNTYFSCVASGQTALAGFMINEGDVAPRDWPGQGRLVSSRDCRLIGCTVIGGGRFRIGHVVGTVGGVDATGTQLRGCTGPVVRLRERDTREASTPGAPLVSTVVLTPSLVGIGAREVDDSSAPRWAEVFADDPSASVASQFRIWGTPGRFTAAYDADGLHLAGGGDSERDDNRVLIWCRGQAISTPDLRVTFRYRRNDTRAAVGTASFLELSAEGRPGGPVPADPTSGTVGAPSLAFVDRELVALRLSFSTAYNPDASQNAQLRLRTQPGAAEVTPGSPNRFPFTAGTWHWVEVTKVGDTVTLTATPDGSRAASFSWTGAGIGARDGPRLGFYVQPERDVHLSAIRVFRRAD